MIALGRKSWLFAGSDRGGERAAVVYSLIATAKLNDVDPRPGSPTCSPASPTIRFDVSTSCCHGTGASQPPFTPPRLPKGHGDDSRSDLKVWRRRHLGVTMGQRTCRLWR
jgi:hypothetical protein